MHKTVTDFIGEVKARHPASFEDAKVLEVGSRYINGTARTFFQRCDYLGLDLAYGPLVDMVCHVADLPSPGYKVHPFDAVISCEALEHDSRWADSLAKMLDLTASGGLLVITCAGPGRPEHGTKRCDPGSSPATTNYYKNVDEGMFWGAVSKTDFSDWRLKVADGDLTFWGVKG